MKTVGSFCIFYTPLMQFVRSLRLFLLPFSALWWLILRLRHALYNVGWIRSESAAIPTVVIGNLELGGTGKTPHALALLTHLSARYPVAFLSRGYGRETNGFRMVDANSAFSEVGDEPLLIARRCSAVKVAVCEDRLEGVKRLKEFFPDLCCVVLDDAFQHRALRADFNILITRFGLPYFRQWLLPAGNLRDISYAAERADMCVVSNTPDFISDAHRREWELSLPAPAFFTRIRYDALRELHTQQPLAWPKKVVVVVGIAHPQAFFAHVSQHASIQRIYEYRDHHAFTDADVQEWAKNDLPVLTTEKDMVRLLHSTLSHELTVLYVPISLVKDAEATLWLTNVEETIMKKKL
jgi:tetraacyldisaccharide 4'-kinase